MKIIDEKLMASLSLKAKESERLRAHFNLHESLEEDIHRLLIATEPGTYFQPHRHFECNKWELMTLLRGKGIVLTFKPDGTVIDRYKIGDGCPVSAIEVPAETYHCFIPVAPDTIFLEVKRGPYMKPSGSDWGSWAPAEGDDEVPAYLDKLKKARPGERP